MLRFRSTQIGLEPRDLTWHSGLHRKRQNLRGNSPSVDIDGRIPQPQVVEIDSKGLKLPIRRSIKQLTEPRAEDLEQTNNSLLSSEPIPRGSRAFWDRVLADAGTPTRTQDAPLGYGDLVEPPNDWLEAHHSSRASFESDKQHIQENANPSGSMCDDSKFNEDEKVTNGPSENHYETSSTSFYSAVASRSSQETVEHPLSEVEAPSLRRGRFASLFHRKIRQDAPDTIFGNHQHRALGNYDGPSDPHRHPSESSSGGSGGELADGLYGSHRDRRTISANWDAFVNESVDGGESDMPPSESDVHDGPVAPLLPTSHGPLKSLMRQPSGLPRSPLHISQAALSISPEKFCTATPNQNDQALGISGLLSQPPRRRNMRYRPRSETYSYLTSEESYHSSLSNSGNRETSSATRDNSALLDISYPQSLLAHTPQNGDMNADEIHAASSPPQLPVYHPIGAETPSSFALAASPASSAHEAVRITSYYSLRSISSQSFIDSHTPSPSQTLGPHASPVMPSSTRSIRSSASMLTPNISRHSSQTQLPTLLPSSSRHSSQPQLPLPPPFSATRRNVSFNLALPPSSSPTSALPVTPPTDHQQPPNLSTTPHTPPNSHIRNISPFDDPPPMMVYNDSLPATTQPQTPADLSRPGHRRYAQRNPFNSAPPRIRDLQARQAPAIASWNRFPVTPTRDEGGRLRGERNETVENMGSVAPEERLWRRQRGLEMGIGREERERLGL
ncbi:MAG: hypothetical protein Q9164_005315 [Protoblastenia rupestris]